MTSVQIRAPHDPNLVAQEIELLIADNQLDLATKKLMDFSSNFGRYRRFRTEALDIRRSFSQWREEHRSYPDSQRVHENSTKLVSRMLDFLDEVLGAIPYISSEGSNVSNPNDMRSSPDEEWQHVGRINNPGNSIASALKDSESSNRTSDKVPEMVQQPKILPMLSKAQSIRLEDVDPKGEDRFSVKKAKFRQTRQKYGSNSEAKEGRFYSENTAFYGEKIEKQYRGKSTNFRLFIEKLELKFGEITSLVGENGNGKTTLLRIAAGQLRETSGDIRYPALLKNGDSSRLDYSRVKRQIAYIPQELPRWSGLLVDNLHFSAAAHGVKGKDNEFEVDFILNRLGLEKYRDSTWSEISGGFRMRFALAKVLLWNPKIIILDEPLANLDVNAQMIFLEDLRDIADSIENRKTILLSSQHLHEVEGITDNIIFIRDGSAVYNGRLADFGENRSENSFEIICNLSRRDLLGILEKAQIPCLSINVLIYRHYIINVPRDVTSKVLIKLFADKDIEVSFFRDISRSTKRLFSDQANQE